jgi:iron complex outermembrane receptor protein
MRTQQPSGSFVRAFLLGLLFATAGPGLVSTAVAQQRPVNLVEMSLEELLTLEITSAGKKSQLIGETAAAIYVITSDDIRRSQATSVMGLLRQVPGMYVARENTGKWSISIRGFANENANKLLVLIDGRTLYTPIFTGVEWKAQDTLLEDVDRIEVIRGPGASLWGANAVNGVINIITKDASETQGAVVAAQTGTMENGTLSARYGGALGESVHYRVFSKYFNRSSLPTAEGETPWGGWSNVRQGARVDVRPTGVDHISISSEWFINKIDELDDEMTPETFPFETEVEERDRTKGTFVLGRWARQRANGSDFSVQAFFDRNQVYDASRLDRDEWVETADVEFQYHLTYEGRHDLVWGGGFRQVRDLVGPAIDSWFTPDRFTARTYNAFVQDEIGWLDKTVRLTLGSKLESNAFSGMEIQPTARLLWAPTPQHSVWTAASRAVRVPSRYELDQFSIEDIEEEDDVLAYDLLIPSHRYKPEAVRGYEAGYRFLPIRQFSLDVSTFSNVYTDLQTVEHGEQLGAEAPIRGLMTPMMFTNQGYGKVYGAEILAFWTISDRLQVSGSYSRLQMRMDSTGLPHNEDGIRMEELYSPNMFFARAYLDLPFAFELNGEVRRVGSIPGQEVDGYIDGNIHLSREMARGLRLHLSVDDAMHRRHAEWNEGELMVPRAVRVGFTWGF